MRLSNNVSAQDIPNATTCEQSRTQANKRLLPIVGVCWVVACWLIVLISVFQTSNPAYGTALFCTVLPGTGPSSTVCMQDFSPARNIQYRTLQKDGSRTDSCPSRGESRNRFIPRSTCDRDTAKWKATLHRLPRNIVYGKACHF